MADDFDLVIRGGVVVTPAMMGRADIGVRGAKIAQLGGELRGRREIDADGRYVFPGGVDIHVHLTSPREPAPGIKLWADDFYSGSLAALAGGVTTIGNITFQRKGETPRDALASGSKRPTTAGCTTGTTPTSGALGATYRTSRRPTETRSCPSWRHSTIVPATTTARR